MENLPTQDGKVYHQMEAYNNCCRTTKNTVDYFMQGYDRDRLQIENVQHLKFAVASIRVMLNDDLGHEAGHEYWNTFLEPQYKYLQSTFES